MKKIIPFIGLILLSAGNTAAQGSSYQYSFQDSLRVILENTKSTDAATVGDAFSAVFSSMGPDQQQVIKRQAKMMKRKAYKLQPSFVNYFGSIVNAINIEKTDPANLSAWLTVAGQVIAKEQQGKATDFFIHSRDFFASHLLNDSKFYKLKALNDTYSFDYISPKPFVQDTSQNNAQPAVVDSSVAQTSGYMVPILQPDPTGPVIRFSAITLNFATSYDSTTLQNTRGVFSLRDLVFVGQGGRFNWTSAGFGADSVYYEFAKYNFKTASPYLQAGQGRMTFKGKLPGAVPGLFEFKSVQHKDKKSATYPRFVSYESNIPVLGLGSDKLKYTGGFGVQGSHPNSSSVSGRPSEISVQGDTDKKFKARSRLFEFQDSTITSTSAQITIYQGNDSITHPSVYLGFDIGKEILTIIKNKGPLGKAPYSSTFFNVDFSADQLVWPLRSDSLNIFSPGNGKISPAIFESVDFFDPEDYRLLLGQGFRFHPLAFVVAYSRKTAQTDFFVYDLATKYSLNEVKTAMEFLAERGMIDYDSKSGKIHVKEKAIHFVESMRGITDYDNLKIHSIANKTGNATINFKKGYMTLRGVDEFKLSDSLNVVIKPDSATISLLHNRDIKFNGTITAGNFEITGKDFTLKYDSFFINLHHIDSIRFYVTEKDGSRRRVNNSMVGADSTAAAAGGLAGSNKTSATLFINDPSNKSGKKNIPNYPRLDATAGGVIYFDRPEVLNGAYDRSVFFVIPPFKLDSLSDADPGSINFEGTFISSGMMPSFKEKLHTMADKSLGFTHTAPPTGLQLFQGDGKLFGAINLDNSGLRSIGRIDYLAASVESQDFIFYPDSVVGKGKIGSIKEERFGNVFFPQVTLPEFKMKWLPKQDKMNLRNLRDPFSLYKSSASLNGRLTVSKSGLSGGGTLNTRGSEVVSRDFKFTSQFFGARHARFEVKTDNPEKPALGGNDIRLNFDLGKNIATISPEVEGVAAISFPYAQFKTSIQKAVWILDSSKIIMSKAADVPLENSYFYTTKKELDSLNFNAERAEYDIKTQQLKVSGIPYIIVADAKITPENNQVLILENAKIGQLKNTTIVLDTINGYHRLTKGVVDIISRKQFTGYATYQYVNSAGDTFAIKMTDFHLQPIADAAKVRRRDRANLPAQETVATGAVIDKDLVLIAPRIFYKGDMTMYATKPALQLKGYVRLDLRKIKNYNTWLAYNQSGDEKDIYLNFDKTVTEEGRRAEAGLHFGSDNALYITFISEKKNSEDEDFFLPSGSLFFDKESSEFKIEDREKAAGTKLSGKVFDYNEEKQEVHFEGPVNFFKSIGDFSLTSSALGSGSLETNDIKMNSFIMLDMNLPSSVFQLMAQNLQDVIKGEGATDGLGDQTELLYKIADIVGERTVKEYEQRSLQGYVPLSSIPALNKPVVFSVVNLKYSQKAKAFYSEGTLGISNIGKIDVNGAFEGFMEVRRNEDGSPVFHVFFKASPEAWFYFGYEDNRLMVQSSNAQINDLINKKTNASKAKVGEVVYIPGTDEEVLSFINRFRKTYYGRDDSYELTAPSAAAVPADAKTEKKEEKKKDSKDEGF